MSGNVIERIKVLSSHGFFRDLVFALLFLLFGGGITCFVLLGTFFLSHILPNYGWIALALISIWAIGVSLVMWLVYCFTVRRNFHD